jgi:hypothetical protein
VFNAIRRMYHRLTVEKSSQCAECGARRPESPRGSQLYFIPLCASCFRSGPHTYLCQKYESAYRAYVNAVTTGSYDAQEQIRDWHHEQCGEIHRLRTEAYRLIRRGQPGDAQRAGELEREAETLDAELKTKMAELKGAA